MHDRRRAIKVDDITLMSILLYCEHDGTICPKCQAKIEVFQAVVRAAIVVFRSTAGGKLHAGRIWKTACPHGVSPNYPTHAWWCDACWGALEDALAHPFVRVDMKGVRDADLRGGEGR